LVPAGRHDCVGFFYAHFESSRQDAKPQRKFSSKLQRHEKGMIPYRITGAKCGLHLSFYSAKCGGVNEHEIGVLAVVSYLRTMVYERFSMAGPPAFILSHCLTSGYGILG
jgi:hypothetical protein